MLSIIAVFVLLMVGSVALAELSLHYRYPDRLEKKSTLSIVCSSLTGALVGFFSSGLVFLALRCTFGEEIVTEELVLMIVSVLAFFGSWTCVYKEGCGKGLSEVIGEVGCIMR